MAEKTMVKVRGFGGDSQVHRVTGEPEELQTVVNEAIRTGDRFVSFAVPKGKKLSVIAKRVEAIWQE